MMRSRRQFHINRDKKKFLGVCAGIASYLDVAAVLVRIVFVVAFLMGAWFLIPLYFMCYFLMDNNSGEFKEKITSSSTFKHFKSVDYKKTLYRNTEEAKFLGVCSGVADYFEIDVGIVRLVTFVLLFIAGPIPWIAYFAAYFILDIKREKLPKNKQTANNPRSEPNAQNEQRGQQEQRERFKKRDYSTRSDFQRCARKFSNLHERLARMEAFVTSKQFHLHQEFKEL